MPEDWRASNVTQKHQQEVSSQPHFHLCEGDGATYTPDVTTKQLNENIISNSQNAFTKGKPFLTNQVAFYDIITGWVDEGRAVDVAYLDYSKALTLFSTKCIQRSLVCME